MSSSSTGDFRESTSKRESNENYNTMSVDDIIEQVYCEEMKQALEKYNRRSRALQAMKNIHPDIAIERPKPSLVNLRVEEATILMSTCGLEPKDGESFYFNLAHQRIPCIYNRITGSYDPQHPVLLSPLYLDKFVREGNVGTTDIIETENEIVLPPINMDENWSIERSYQYVRRVYRNRHGVIVSYFNEYLVAKALDEEYVVKIFGTTPWLLRKRCDEGICNIVIRNLHQEEDTRRYIFSSIPCDFFMVQNELFAVFLTPPSTIGSGYGVSVVSCVSMKKIFERLFPEALNISCCTTNAKGIVSISRINTTWLLLFTA